MKILFLIPTLLGIAFAAMALAFPDMQALGLSRKTLIIVAAVSFIAAGLLAYTTRNPRRLQQKGGAGGDANASQGGTAIGGAGGNAGMGSGGSGGSAIASGPGSRAQGGRGGDG
jgi:hypothetical protein